MDKRWTEKVTQEGSGHFVKRKLEGIAFASQRRLGALNT
jgi:hypothetical protein